MIVLFHFYRFRAFHVFKNLTYALQTYKFNKMYTVMKLCSRVHSGMSMNNYERMSVL